MVLYSSMKVSKIVLEELRKRKIIDRESFDDVLRRILEIKSIGDEKPH